MSVIMWCVLAVALFAWWVVRQSKRVSPDCVVVFFSDKARQKITNWQRGGLALIWPWQNVGKIHMQALTLNLSVQNPPLCLTEGEPVRLVFAVEENHGAISKATGFFLDKNPDDMLGVVQNVLIRHFEGLQVSALRVDRKHFEPLLQANMKQSLSEMGMALISVNFDGIFGDAPEIRYCVADDASGA